MKVSWVQICLLYISAKISVAAVALPALTAAPYPNRDLWLIPFLAAPAILLVGNIAVKLGEYFPRKTIVEYSKTLTGPFIGTLIAILYSWWYIYMAALGLRISSDFFLTGFLPDTPISVLIGAVMLTSVYAARRGYQVVARVNQVLFPVIVSLILILFFLALPQVRLTNLTPVMAGGLPHLVLNSITPIAFFSDIINIVMIAPFITNTTQTPRIVKWGVSASTLFLLIMLFSVITFLGIDVARGLIYPGLVVARQIDIADFIQRVEVLLVLIWLAGIFVSITLGLIWASLALAQGFNLISYEPMVLPLALVVTVTTFLLGDNVLEYSALFHPGFIAPYYLTYSLFIPLILLILAHIKYGRPSRPDTPINSEIDANADT